MKRVKPSLIALCLASLSAPLAAQDGEESKKWHRKSDAAKGVDQLTAPAKGKVYANPDRQKALDDAMHSGGTSRPTPNGKPKSGKKSPQR